MTSQTTSPRLTPTFVEAVQYAAEKHAAQTRKGSDIPYLGHLLSVADKLHNARAILRDFRDLGAELWQRFNVKDPQQHLWYYRSLLEVYTDRIDNWLVDELRDVIDTLEHEVGQAA